MSEPFARIRSALDERLRFARRRADRCSSSRRRACWRFSLYVGTLTKPIADDAQHASQRALAYQREDRTIMPNMQRRCRARSAARALTFAFTTTNASPASRSARGNASTGRFTRTIAAALRASPAVVRLPGGTIVVAPDFAASGASCSRYLAFVLPIGALAVLAAWLIGRAITRRAIAPLQEVAAALRRIAAGDFRAGAVAVGRERLARAHRARTTKSRIA